MLEVQQLLRPILATGDITQAFSVLKELGIEVKDYPDYKMFVLNYDLLEAQKGSKVVEECRGLILSYTGDIIRKGFNRFYNLGENGVTDFDFKNSIVFEKADGTLIQCFRPEGISAM